MANENWSYSVGGVVIRDGAVLLVRHTYGAANGKLLIPGGFLQIGEMPDAAVLREVREETGVLATAKSLLAMRFTAQEAWYAVFMMEYISGEPVSDGDENSEALFMPVEEAVLREDLTDFSRRVIKAATSGAKVLDRSEFCSAKFAPDQYALYGL